MVKGNSEDAVTKDEFMKFFTHQDHQLPAFEFKQILNLLRQNKYLYESQKNIRGSRGALVCIKFNEIATKLDWFATIVPGYRSTEYIAPTDLDAGKFFLYCRCTAGFNFIGFGCLNFFALFPVVYLMLQVPVLGWKQ